MRELKALSCIYEIPAALPGDVCREMIRRFETNGDQQVAGRIGQGSAVESSIKKTTDLRISGRAEWKDIDCVLHDSLARALRQFATLHPYFSANRFKDIGYNLQRYLPGEYYHWHVDGGPGEFSQRQLVAIWYLNTVPGPGGATDFALQEVSVIPEEGKLVLFPPFWTHVHRAETLESGAKYIATTWVCFA